MKLHAFMTTPELTGAEFPAARREAYVGARRRPGKSRFGNLVVCPTCGPMVCDALCNGRGLGNYLYRGDRLRRILSLSRAASQ